MVHVSIGGIGRNIWVSIFDNETDKGETFYGVRRTREILTSLGYSDIHEPDDEEDPFIDDDDWQDDEQDNPDPF